jgi:hypothetical protein
MTIKVPRGMILYRVEAEPDGEGGYRYRPSFRRATGEDVPDPVPAPAATVDPIPRPIKRGGLPRPTQGSLF